MRRIIPTILIIIGAYFAWDRLGLEYRLFGASNPGDHILAEAFRDGADDLQVEGNGKVVRILPDDNDGSRHQRFILKLTSGQTLLVAHNIDLAPRISSLREGDSVAFYGEYEWNSKGGAIHWTHHDPQGRHVTGWLKHNGETYE